ncbi:MAG: DUF4062 domain-containing protein [Verrucomicrobia bacterium]|nr:DUF4062 domain-containing protein [Verrucomicrobiota bacterium]
MQATVRSGQVLTFYSFKGGTGRSMALANLAWFLASMSKRVLAIDWDLEAPGLHRYFQPFLPDQDLSNSKGVIDFVSDFALQAMTPELDEQGQPVAPPQDWYLPYANILRCALPLNYPFDAGGRIDFVPSGRQDASYSSRVNSFDWKDFYDCLGGWGFIEAVRRHACSEYDFILIDSRTGVSDTSGICTVQMPDTLVVCFTLNNQSIDGAAAVVESVLRQRPALEHDHERRPLRIFPVPMRIDPFEQDRLAWRKRYAGERFGRFPDHLKPDERERYRNEVQFPYVPYYSYEEILAIFRDQPGDPGTLLASVERLAAHLLDGSARSAVPPSEPERQRIRALYEQRLPVQEPFDLFLTCDLADRQWTWENLASRLEKEIWQGHPLRIAFAPRYDRPWEAWAQAIGPALMNSRRIALLLSPGSSGFTDTFLNHLTIGPAGTAALQDKVILLDRTSQTAPSSLPGSRIDCREEAAIDTAYQQLLVMIRGESPAPPVPQTATPSVTSASNISRSSVNPAELLEKAKAILRQKSGLPEELLALAGRLKGVRQFGYARKLLDLAAQSPNLDKTPALRLKIGQQRALCTYQDPDQPRTARFKAALQILQEVDNLDLTTNQETLGLAGAIHKRLWQVDGQRRHLDRALSFYLRGYERGVAEDYGYTAINAAFVLDLLASIELTEPAAPRAIRDTARAFRQQATGIRREVLAVLLPMPKKYPDRELDRKWWFLVTMAEAHFGLRQFAETRLTLKRAAALPDVAAWEFETTARQLVALIRAQREPEAAKDRIASDHPEAVRVLTEFLGGNTTAHRTALLGKVGLALSGGGFRASLFHIGVLAKLAELDLLRHVEVLSCVSGGSIVGAHYYLEARRLLQTKRDAQITGDDYVQLVQRLAADLLAGVQTNIRTRVAASFISSLKAAFLPYYSRTERLGKLLDQRIFARVRDGEQDHPRRLAGLFIRPLGEPDEFAPKHDNWRRQSKVPILILNATTLNTGHNWQFTASWMGEPPDNLDSEVNGTERLRRMYYDDAPAPHNEMLLGRAVAASACVPGLFEPITLTGLYPDRLVRLVDGGVHDNQGIASLLEQDCTVLLVSDASGQMNTLDAPSIDPVGVPLRSNSILMARVREAQFAELAARRSSSLLRGLMFLHLKKDLLAAAVDWEGCADYNRSEIPQTKALTSYGLAQDTQSALSALRTDLDSFSEAEAAALMTSGYRMTERFVADAMAEFPSKAPALVKWWFLAVEKAMQARPDEAAKSARLLELLEVGRQRTFKARTWLLLKDESRVPVLNSSDALFLLMLTSSLLVGGLCLAFGWLGQASSSLVSWLEDQPALLIISFSVWLLSCVALKVIAKSFRFKKRPCKSTFREWLSRLGLGLVMSTVGYVLARIDLHVFNKPFLKAGRLERLVGPTGTPSKPRRRIYISSTYEDLREYRSKVQEALKRDFEMVTAELTEPTSGAALDLTLELVANCDVYLGILAWRYGYVPAENNPEGFSITELEYRRAHQSGKVCLIFLADDHALWPPAMVDRGASGDKMTAFRQALKKSNDIGYFANAEDLKRKILEALSSLDETEASEEFTTMPPHSESHS